tara:strand:+ start:1214 stop:2809 length:1596 start_codon:yes stop_codon:yes gene_type:complete
MNEYSEPTKRFISNIGRTGHTYRWETPITKEDLKLIMLDLMKDCGLEFSDVQHMVFSTKTFTKWLEQNNKPVHWAALVTMVYRQGTYNPSHGINKLSQIWTVLFPDYPWREYLFPSKSWKIKKNRTDMMEDLVAFNGFTSHEDFYDVTTYDFFHDFAIEVMKKERASYSRAGKISMSSVVLANEWGSWYEMVMEYWNDKVAEGYNNGKPIIWEKYRFLAVQMTEEENLEQAKIWWKLTKERAGIKTKEDLYSLETTELLNYPGGKKFVENFREGRGSLNCNGLASFLELMGEEFDWFKLHKIRKVDYWSNDEYCREYLLKLIEHYELDEPSNLPYVIWEMIVDYHGESFCRKYGRQGVANRICELFPEEHLEPRDFIYYNKGEKFGVKIFQNWFGYENIIGKFKLSTKWSNGNSMEMDCLIKSLNLVVEFNGLSHYSVSFFIGRLKHRPNYLKIAAKRFARQQECDIIKRLCAEGLGYRYLILPWTKHDPNLPKWNKTFDEKTKKSQGVSFIKLCELQGITREEIEGALYG